MLRLEDCSDLENGKLKFLKDVFDISITAQPDFNESFYIILKRNNISERDADMLIMRYFESRKFIDIAKEFNLSQDRVRQIVRGCVSLFKSPLSKSYLSVGIEATNIFLKRFNNIENVKNIGVEVLELNTSLYYCLKRGNINTIGDLVKTQKSDLFKIRNFGVKHYKELIEACNKYGVELNHD